MNRIVLALSLVLSIIATTGCVVKYLPAISQSPDTVVYGEGSQAGKTEIVTYAASARHKIGGYANYSQTGCTVSVWVPPELEICKGCTPEQAFRDADIPSTDTNSPWTRDVGVIVLLPYTESDYFRALPRNFPYTERVSFSCPDGRSWTEHFDKLPILAASRLETVYSKPCMWLRDWNEQRWRTQQRQMWEANNHW